MFYCLFVLYTQILIITIFSIIIITNELAYTKHKTTDEWNSFSPSRIHFQNRNCTSKTRWRKTSIPVMYSHQLYPDLMQGSSYTGTVPAKEKKQNIIFQSTQQQKIYQSNMYYYQILLIQTITNSNSSQSSHKHRIKLRIRISSPRQIH